MLLLGVSFLSAPFLAGQFVAQQTPVRYRYRVVKTLPHDKYAFTQGLEYHDGLFWEGTGLNGRSSLRRVKPDTGEVLQKVDLESTYFGEGISVIGQRVLQLTWKAQQGFIYDRKTMKRTGQFAYPGEGWGLAHDAKAIYMSDGSAQIRVWDPTTLKEVRRITVKAGNREVDQLNELEVVEGEIFANVWQSDVILRISPVDGRVLGILDMRGLLDPNEPGAREADVLNGIAYDAATKRLFVTGKLWPKIYQIEIFRAQ